MNSDLSDFKNQCFTPLHSLYVFLSELRIGPYTPPTHTHTNKSLEKTLRNMVRDLAYQRGEVSRGEMGAGSWGQAKHPV